MGECPTNGKDEGVKRWRRNEGGWEGTTHEKLHFPSFGLLRGRRAFDSGGEGGRGERGGGASMEPTGRADPPLKKRLN